MLGAHKLALGGNFYTLRYDWEALSLIQEKHNIVDLDDVIARCFPCDIAFLLSCGLQKRHPEMTAESIIDLSPALIPCVEAIKKGLMLSLFGQNQAEQQREIKKKMMLRYAIMLLIGLIAGFTMAAQLQNFLN